MDSAHALNTLLRDGVITHVDHAQARCRVHSGQTHTDFIPWLTLAGHLRLWAPPSEGEAVQLLCAGGDLANAIALRGLYCNAFPAPSDASHLTLLQFADGAVLRYDHAAHALDAMLPAAGTVTLIAQGGIALTGPVTITGDTTILGALQVDGAVQAHEEVTGAGIALSRHTHPGVQPGGGDTGAPA